MTNALVCLLALLLHCKFFSAFQPELRPDTLPSLLREVDSVLVLGCGGDESEGAGLLRGVVSSPEHSHFKFAWMDR